MKRMMTWAAPLLLLLAGGAGAKELPTSKGDTPAGSTPMWQASQGTSKGRVDKRAPRAHWQGGSFSGSRGPFQGMGTYGSQRNATYEQSGTTGASAAQADPTLPPTSTFAQHRR
jgi:hypothetical protein